MIQVPIILVLLMRKLSPVRLNNYSCSLYYFVITRSSVFEQGRHLKKGECISNDETLGVYLIEDLKIDILLLFHSYLKVDLQVHI